MFLKAVLVVCVPASLVVIGIFTAPLWGPAIGGCIRSGSNQLREGAQALDKAIKKRKKK